jgi:type IV pilus assembly protein PilY1
LYPTKFANAASTVGIWDVQANSWWSVVGNAGGSYVMYSANYLNYYYDSAMASTNTKVAVLQQAAASILNSISNVNVGLMRYDTRGAGGMVLDPIAPVATSGPQIIADVNANAPAGTTPISETLYEAYLYYSNGGVHFGNNSYTSLCNQWVTNGAGLKTCNSYTTKLQPSVASSRNPAVITGTNYASPANNSCQKNYIVFLTDGLPNADYKADTLIKKLPNFASTAGSCYASQPAMYASFGLTVPSGTDGTGLCSAAMSSYMYKNDMRPDVSAVQNVTTYMIGFGNDFADSSGAPTASFAYLNDIATKGGGKAYTATSLADLTSAFNDILANVAKTNTLFSAPAVAVNAFNRTQTLNDLYVSVFSPKTTYHWPGNVKHYQIVNNVVVDANGTPAVDASTGFFKATSQSFWSTAVDGYDVTLGGAANNIPDPSVRNVYTYIGPNPKGAGNAVALTGSANTTFNTANPLLTPAILSIGGPSDPSLSDLINWARGQDILDDNNDGSTTDTRHAMGDPIHTAPAVVVYGLNPDGTNNTVAFTPTNDGYLHAINAATGVELWSFIPQEMLVHLVDLFNDAPSPTKHYGIDGAISVLKYDINGDGTIDPAAGDKLILYFSTGRNTDTSVYYALDATDQNHPKLLWAIDGSTLNGLGQSWSQPAITRVNVNGATQNSQRLALVIGGGYDPAEDGYSYLSMAAGTQEYGSHVYMVDALYGNLLWSAGNTASDNLINARMDHAIPSSVAVLDTNSDGYADRMYVGDMAGQIWRFDITNGNTANTLVAGGVIASLGTREDSPHRAVADRRFYNVPDISMVEEPGVTPYIDIALGSGYRGHPLDKTVQDRFYAVRDIVAPFGNLTQTNFNTRTSTLLIRDAEAALPQSLVDITTFVAPVIPAGSVGWQLDLNQHGGWVGEKVLSAASTFNDAVIFTTYSPTSTVQTDPCAGVGAGTNRSYLVSVFDGSPELDRNKDGIMTTADRSADLAQGGIAPQTAFLFLSNAANGGNGQGGPGNGPPKVTCLAGVEVLNLCTNFNQRRKTYWREGMAN